MNKPLSVIGGILFLVVFCINRPVLYAQSTTIELITTGDAMISSKFPTTKYGSNTTLNVQYDSRNLIYRSALKFDLSSIPSNAKITSAILRLKPNVNLVEGTYTSHRLDRFSASWEENAITYSTQPGVATGSGITTSTGDGVYRRFDVLSDVKNLLDGTYTNYGWLLRLNNETVQYSGSFSSREVATQVSKPTLIVSYYLPVKVTNALINHASSTSSSDGSIAPTITGGSGNYTYQWTNGATGSVVSTSASLTGVGYGWYGLHVTDNTSGFDTYMAFILGVECGTATIDFKPGPEYVDDAIVYNLIRNGVNYGNNNYGSSSTIQVEKWTYGSWYDMKSLLKFRLWMDQDVSVDLADLYLTGGTHNPLSRPNNSELRYISSAWEESNVTYNTAPNFASTPLQAIQNTTATNENRVLDLTDFWNQWKVNNTQNNGMFFQLQSYAQSYTRMQFHSSDATTAANRPWIQFEINLQELDGCSNIYAKIERSLRGVKYDVYNNKLYFYHENEYENQQTSLIYRIFSSTNRVSPVQSGTQSPVAVKYGDNRYQLDVSSLSAGSYVLEVENDKKETFYLRFIK